MTAVEFIAAVIYASLWDYWGGEHQVAIIWLQYTAEGRHEDASDYLRLFCA